MIAPTRRAVGVRRVSGWDLSIPVFPWALPVLVDARRLMGEQREAADAAHRHAGRPVSAPGEQQGERDRDG